MDENEAGEVERTAEAAGVNCVLGYSFRFSMGRFLNYVHDRHLMV
jgi:hypothetical protein